MTTVKTAATKPRKKGVLNRMLEKTAYRLKFNRTALNIQAADLLREEIAKQGIVQKDLAHKLNISAPRLSQILNTEEKNLTLGTIADIATALDKQFQLSLKPDPHIIRLRKSDTRSLSATVEKISLAESGDWEVNNPKQFKPVSVAEVVYES